LHIPWDEAGCLCPVGDLFNYAAPGEESNDLENVVHLMNASSLEDTSLSNGETTDDFIGDQPDIRLERLTDGGFDENMAAYCFYARKNYKKGTQVLRAPCELDYMYKLCSIVNDLLYLVSCLCLELYHACRNIDLQLLLFV